MSLKKCLGFNYNLPNSVYNLADNQKSEIFFISGNFGVVYDYKTKEQRILQGHTN